MNMNNYFCVLPFFGYEYAPDGNGTHCCLLPKNYNIDAIRESMLAGQRSEFCNACWNLEDKGLVSDRKLKNSALDFYWDRDIRFIEEDARQGKYQPIMIKNIASNTCNSTCVTCSSKYSTAWGPLEKKIGLVPFAPVSMTEEHVAKNLNFKEMLSLNLIGGEPLYKKLNFYILKQLIAHGNDKCFIQITTNGSTVLSDDNKKLLKQFKNLNFNVSIDGVGAVFEYLRYPIKWDEMLTTLDYFKSITDNISVSYTVSNLNVLYHLETVEWFKKENLPYNYNPVIYPGHFKPSALPESIKMAIFNKYGRTEDLESFLGAPHSDQDDINFAKMLSVISKQDNVKGISYTNFLPELASLISSNLPASA